MAFDELAWEGAEEKLQVDIWSDVTCPYCYTAKRKWEQALAQFPHRSRVQVSWRSFELAPHLKTDPSQRMPAFFASLHHLPLEEAQRLCDQMERTASRAGLEFHYDRIIPANSFRAHRLSHFAKEQGLQDSMEERLFRAYFTEGKNIDDLATLVLLGKEVGLEEAEVRTVLEGEGFRDEVLQDLHRARSLGVGGVPYFVVDQTTTLSGERDVSVLLQWLEDAFERWARRDRVCTVGEACL